MTIGVGVEGYSELAFWSKVLPKHFRGVRFDIRNMKNREKLIRETPRLLEMFRDAHYAAAFILLDLHRLRCVTAARNEFDVDMQQEMRKPIGERYLLMSVAVRGLEAWFLADEVAIASVLPAVTYSAPKETGDLNPKKTLQKLWRTQHGNVSPSKILFAKSLAPKFSPKRAALRSASFSLFWARMKEKCRARARAGSPDFHHT